MKVGLSFSRCLRDIVEGKVDYDDVLIIIARTDFNPNVDEQWTGIWNGYHFINQEWGNFDDEYEEHFHSIAKRLYNEGKLHQPRQFNAWPSRRPEYWLETFLPPDELETRPAVKAAWDNFQVVAGLTNTKLNKEYQ